MKLSTLLMTTPLIRINHEPAPSLGKGWPGQDRHIGSLHYRAQEVKPGGLFVAIPGLVADGHDYIGTALARGAAAVVTQRPVSIEKGSAEEGQAPVLIQVENPRKALAQMAAQFFGNPSKAMCVVGITGTNGKTTTAYLVESIFKQAGFRTGVIGTINYHYNGKSFENPVTTPESLDLQRILSAMRNDGATHVIMEASSHAIDLDRIEACWMDVGVFTNLTQDHLDYHRNMERYWACKRRLFTDHLTAGPKSESAMAVVNCDDPRGEALSADLAVPAVNIGAAAHNTVWPKTYRNRSGGLSGIISTPTGEFDFDSPLVGGHNLENIMCAVGVGLVLKLPLETIQAGIENLRSVPGRLEPIENDAGRFVYVDYAHTPDALRNVLTALRQLAARRLVCVFGCGGDRDNTKRPQMGEIAGTLCDLSIVTSDNPRSEAPEAIIDQIVAGMKRTCPYEYDALQLRENGLVQKGYVIETDRKKAIGLGIAVSGPEDIVLIAGKGHETYQILGERTIDFDDRKEARAAIRVMGW